ncbi:MAG: hypothetical protein WB779_00835 [Ignavibacteriaceae bacterium]
MNNRKITGFTKILFTCSVVTLSVFMFGCKDSVNAPNLGTTNQTNLSAVDKQAMTQITELDSVIASFDPNFNESQSDSYLGKVNNAVTPYFVWQHVILTNKTYDFTPAGDSVNIGDSVYVKLTKTYQGVLNIAASNRDTLTRPDTIITKNFTTTVVTRLLFQRIDTTSNPMHNWKLLGVSLVSGGTNTGNFQINSLTLTFASNDSTITITDPSNFFIDRSYRWKWGHRCPEFHTNDSVTVAVEVYSAYADTDFVTLTYGADFFGLHRNKVKLNLVSQTASGGGYLRVYQRTFNVRNNRGYFSAVLNALTRQSIYDDSAPVESNTWGLPYKVGH